MIVVAIVLAGGASRRFGGDKLAADLDGRTVLAHAVAAATACSDRVVVVIGPEDGPPSIAGIELVRDPVAHGGPLAGLVAGLGAVASEDLVLLLAGDMPEVQPVVLAELLDRLRADPALGATHLEADPVATLPMALRPGMALPAARSLLAADRRSLRGLLDAIPSAAVPAGRWHALDPARATLRDIDTRADLGLER